MKKESKVVLLDAGLIEVFEKFTNLKNFESNLNEIPDTDLRNNINLTGTSIHIDAKGILNKIGILGNNSWDGKIEKTILREDYGEIQYSLSGSGINSGTLWIQLIPIIEKKINNKTKARLVVDLDINLLSSVGIVLKMASSDQIETVVNGMISYIEKLF